LYTSFKQGEGREKEKEAKNCSDANSKVVKTILIALLDG
jgi:hypothetical protein